MTDSPPSTEVFDDIGMLKADAALALGFGRAERTAATGPGPAFPAVLHRLVDAVPRRSGATIVDLGAGMGGASTWLADATAARVIAVEPADGARRAARRLFTDLDIRSGTAAQSGLEDGVADAVTLLGVISLIDDLDGVLAEARRLLRPHGVLGIADMFLTGDGDGVEHSGANTLRSLAATAATLGAGGFEVVAVDRAADAKPAESWQHLAGRLRDWLLSHHGGDDAVKEWMADQQQLEAWIDGRHVVGACIVARPSGATP